MRYKTSDSQRYCSMIKLPPNTVAICAAAIISGWLLQPACSIERQPADEKRQSRSDISYAIKPESAKGPLHLVVETGHADGVSCVKFSPDGKVLATGSWDNMVKLWDVENRKEMYTCGRHPACVRDVIFSPDGQTLASSCYRGMVKIWDCNSGQEIGQIVNEPYSRHPNVVAFTDDGKSLLVFDGIKLRSYDLVNKSWKSVLKPKYENPDAEVVATHLITQDGKKLIVVNWGDTSGTLSIFDSTTGKLVKILCREPGEAKYWGLDASHDGAIIALCREVSETKPERFCCEIWNSASGNLIKRIPVQDKEIPWPTLSADGKTVALSELRSGSDKVPDGHLFDIKTGKELAQLRYEGLFTDPEGGLPPMAFSSDGKTIVTGYQDAEIKLWNRETGKEIGNFGPDKANVRRGSGNYPEVTLIFGKDGKTLSSLTEDGSVRVFDLASNHGLRTVKISSTPVHPIATSPDGNEMLVGADDGSSKLLNLKKGLVVQSVSAPYRTVSKSESDFRKSFQTSCKLLAKAAKLGLTLCDPDIPGSAYIPASHSTIACSSSRNSLEIEPLASKTAKKIVVPLKFNTQETDYAVSNNSKKIAVAGFPWSPHWPDIVILNAADGQELLRLSDKESNKECKGNKDSAAIVYPTRVCFGADDNTLFVGYADGSIRCFDLKTKNELFSLTGHPATIEAMALDDSGRFLASAGRDSSIRIFDLGKRQEVIAIYYFNDRDWISVTPDNRFDGTAGGMERLHWLVAKKIVPLNEFKQRYYQPGLLAKSIKTSSN